MNTDNPRDPFESRVRERLSQLGSSIEPSRPLSAAPARPPRRVGVAAIVAATSVVAAAVVTVAVLNWNDGQTVTTTPDPAATTPLVPAVGESRLCAVEDLDITELGQEQYAEQPGVGGVARKLLRLDNVGAADCTLDPAELALRTQAGGTGQGLDPAQAAILGVEELRPYSLPVDGAVLVAVGFAYDSAAGCHDRVVDLLVGGRPAAAPTLQRACGEGMEIVAIQPADFGTGLPAGPDTQQGAGSERTTAPPVTDPRQETLYAAQPTIFAALKAHPASAGHTRWIVDQNTVEVGILDLDSPSADARALMAELENADLPVTVRFVSVAAASEPLARLAGDLVSSAPDWAPGLQGLAFASPDIDQARITIYVAEDLEDWTAAAARLDVGVPVAVESGEHTYEPLVTTVTP